MPVITGAAQHGKNMSPYASSLERINSIEQSLLDVYGFYSFRKEIPNQSK